MGITNEYIVAKIAENFDWESMNAMRYWSESKSQTEVVFKKTLLPQFTRHMKPYGFGYAPLSTPPS